MNTPTQPSPPITGELCSDENIAFLMLSEVLRARSQEILEALKEGQVNVTRVRHLALHMSLSAEDLIRSSGLVKLPAAARTQDQSTSHDSEQEPASLHSVLDLCMIAARNRLAELKLDLEPISVPRELFVGGNPWELAYALFLLLRKAASAEMQFFSRSSAPIEHSSTRTFRIELEVAEGFVDICIPAAIPIDPTDISSEDAHNDWRNMSRSEWLCFRRLLENNNALVHVQPQNSSPNKRYRIMLRLPTFQPGHEEPVNFFTEPSHPVLS